MEEQKVGIVVKCFAKPNVAAVELTVGLLKVCDTVRMYNSGRGIMRTNM